MSQMPASGVGTWNTVMASVVGSIFPIVLPS